MSDDAPAAAAAAASHHEEIDCELMWCDNTGATDKFDVMQSVGVGVAQNGGECIQPLDSVYSMGDNVTDDGRVMECSAVADDAETLTAAATSTAAEISESGLLAVDVADNGCVPVAGDVITDDVAARDVDVHDEPAAAAAAAAVPNEPEQPAAADEVAQPVGNIIPAPLAVLAPQGLGDVHQAMMQGGGPVGFQPYKHPNLFALRVTISEYLLNLIMIVIDNDSY